MGIQQAVAVAAAALAISVIEQEQEQETSRRKRTLKEAAPQQSSAIKTKISQSQGMQGGSKSSSVSIRYLEGTTSSDSNGGDHDQTPGGKVLIPISSMARTNSMSADNPAAAAMKKAPSFNETPIVPSMPLKRSESSTAKAKPAATGKPGRVQVSNSEADAWEKVQLEKVKGKYKQQNDDIVSWEDGRKAKARRRLDRAESEMERSRMRALEKFRGDMEIVNKIAGDAKAKAAERMKKEEMKVKEKADAVRRSNGKFPARRPCFCI
ncbi:hypothetical protein LINGRAHAP2_LOCUS18510 [Linum grandiflorum]